MAGSSDGPISSPREPHETCHRAEDLRGDEEGRRAPLIPGRDSVPVSNLPAALLHHAALAGEEPWLFRSEGWDWRWHSWGELARQVTAWAGVLSISLPVPGRPSILSAA